MSKYIPSLDLYLSQNKNAIYIIWLGITTKTCIQLTIHSLPQQCMVNWSCVACPRHLQNLPSQSPVSMSILSPSSHSGTHTSALVMASPSGQLHTTSLSTTSQVCPSLQSPLFTSQAATKRTGHELWHNLQYLCHETQHRHSQDYSWTSQCISLMADSISDLWTIKYQMCVMVKLKTWYR